MFSECRVAVNWEWNGRGWGAEGISPGPWLAREISQLILHWQPENAPPVPFPCSQQILIFINLIMVNSPLKSFPDDRRVHVLGWHSASAAYLAFFFSAVFFMDGS